MEILELKCTITEIKNPMNEYNQKMRAKLRIGKLEVRSLERKGMENMVENIKYIQDIVRKVNMHVTGILKAKRKNYPEVIFEEIQRKPKLIISESSY